MRMKGNVKRLATILMAVLVLFTSIGINPQEVSAKSANRVELKSNKATLYPGEYTTVVPTAVYQNGYNMTAMSNGKLDTSIFKFKSSKKSVATVSAKGVVTAKKAGTCKITVTSIYNSEIKGTFKLTVEKRTQKAKITLEKTKATLVVGKTTTIKVKSLKGISSKTVKFSSSNKKVATVNSKGKVTAKKAGKATITVTSPVNKKVSATFVVTVKTADLIDTTYSKKGTAEIVLEETSATLYPAKSFNKIYDHCGDVYNLTYFTEDYDSQDKFIGKQILAQKEKYGQAQIKIKSIKGLSSRAVTYKSENPSVASVSSSGFVTPKKVGTTTITVTSKADKSVKATYAVTVKKNDMVLAVGFTNYDNIKYYVRKNDDGTIDYRTIGMSTNVYSANKKVATTQNYGQDFIITSSNESVIATSIEDQMLIVKSRGTTKITLKTPDGRWSYSWKVTVSDKPTSVKDYMVGCSTPADGDAQREADGYVTKL